jgi:hypothetical protein
MKQIFKPVSLILIGFSVWITWVCGTFLQFDDAGNLIARSYSVWGDWSAHFTFINGLRERGIGWLAGDNPLFPGIPFQYPFLSHLLTYVFSRVTFLDTIHATYVSSLILLFALPFLLYAVFRKIKLSAWGSLSAVLAFLMIGGFQWMDSSLKTTDPLTNQFDQASVFTQFILFEFFPQRAFLFGLVLLLGSTLYLFRKTSNPKKKWTLRSKIFLGIALSLAAWVHIHTWIAIGVLILFSFIFPPLEKPSPSFRKAIFIFGAGVAALSAILLAFLLLRGDSSSTRMAWQVWMPGWAQNPSANIKRAQDMNFFVFWIFNTGLFLPLAGFGMWMKRKDKTLYALAASGMLLFTIAEFINLQPYYYDNLKLFTVSFLFLAPFVGFALESIASFRKFPKYLGASLAAGLLLLQITSATLDFNSFENGLQKTLFFSAYEFTLAEDFKNLRTSANDIVLITPRHNHWIPCLTGNPVAMGYPGWLWSWGISYRAREKEINEVLLGTPRADAVIDSLHIAYAALQEGEKAANQPVNLNYFETHFKKIYSRGGWSVYSLKDRVMSPSTSVR